MDDKTPLRDLCGDTRRGVLALARFDPEVFERDLVAEVAIEAIELVGDDGPHPRMRLQVGDHFGGRTNPLSLERPSSLAPMEALRSLVRSPHARIVRPYP